MDLAEITAESMRPFEGREFSLAGHDVALVLVEIDEAVVADGERFSLLFEGPTEIQLEQGTWHMQIDGDDFTLFLVPIGPRPSGQMGYEALFSRPGSN